MKGNSVTLKIAIGSASAVLVIIGAATWVGTHTSATSATTDAKPAPATSVVGAASVSPVAGLAIGRLSDRTSRSLGRHGTHLYVEDARTSSPRVGNATAVTAAQRAFGFIAGTSPSELALGRLTVPTYGKETSTNPAVTSKIKPIIENRLVWFVVFHDVEQPVSGPVGPDGEAYQSQATFTAGLWVAVDATTGEVLGGESID